MIYPIVLDPEFLIKIKEDEKLYKKFKEFIIEFKHCWYDIFILVDNVKGNFKEKYKDICKKYKQDDSEFGAIIEYIINDNQTKKIYLDLEIKNSGIDEVLKFLKKNNVKKVIEFPKYFKDEFINVKDCLNKNYLFEMVYDNLIEKIVSVTRFAKTIYLIDPMIPYQITNINSWHSRDHQNIISNLKIKKTDIYMISLGKILESIFKNNFFKKDLKIYLLTTFDVNKINHFKFCIINNIKKLQEFNKAKYKGREYFMFGHPKPKEYNTIDVEGKIFSLLKKNTDENEEEYKKRISKSKTLEALSIESIQKEIENWKKLDSVIKKLVISFVSNAVDQLTPIVEVREHKRKDDDAYERGIIALDSRAALEVRKGFDLIDPSNKKNGLNAKKKFHIRLLSSDSEKASLASILMHQPYKADEIFFTPESIKLN